MVTAIPVSPASPTLMHSVRTPVGFTPGYAAWPHFRTLRPATIPGSSANSARGRARSSASVLSTARSVCGHASSRLATPRSQASEAFPARTRPCSSGGSRRAGAALRPTSASSIRSCGSSARPRSASSTRHGYADVRPTSASSTRTGRTFQPRDTSCIHDCDKAEPLSCEGARVCQPPDQASAGAAEASSPRRGTPAGVRPVPPLAWLMDQPRVAEQRAEAWLLTRPATERRLRRELRTPPPSGSGTGDEERRWREHAELIEVLTEHSARVLPPGSPAVAAGRRRVAKIRAALASKPTAAPSALERPQTSKASQAIKSEVAIE